MTTNDALQELIIIMIDRWSNAGRPYDMPDVQRLEDLAQEIEDAD